ncbi:hypothetical protein GGTG_03997 [Gaeumannomyces tritici R3-111a-1]|uniref:Uncharacterized protein n=1 Tax=Gaeumannomyces tritici (strain R3-111a-1) TaxID=644352 RepID=J3NRU8_GAET3|nr:hypothetical protein GGTG_03997 [Gaeumannomyces tritici R3-111a-1]EJT78904.1 hypothetical protein GGTG_03997 [Gaeumannomyces tritici R3-111a-1]
MRVILQVGECWVPLSALEAVLNLHAICGSTFKVAFGIEATYTGGGGGNICFD